ncbi:CUGBP Elav-like family member 2 isoform X1 [Vespula squamosa]|uniref:CUGBP Elav-like family member 2 isoform X1 n=1 Tax=Vespula squamosa TaxID=30214 RepID=A0ABD2BTA1_VESSQ
MLQSLNALAGKISPSSPTDSNANKVHMHNNNNVVHHHHPYSKQQTQPSPASHSSNNSDQKENTIREEIFRFSYVVSAQRSSLVAIGSIEEKRSKSARSNTSAIRGSKVPGRFIEATDGNRDVVDYRKLAIPLLGFIASASFVAEPTSVIGISCNDFLTSVV